MGEAWLASPDGQDAPRRIAAYIPGRATPGRSTTAAKIAVRTQLASIQATAEATKANTEELIQRAQGKIPERPLNQSAAERKRETDQVLKSVPALRTERKQMADLERQEAKDAKLAAQQQKSAGKRQRTTTSQNRTVDAASEASSAHIVQTAAATAAEGERCHHGSSSAEVSTTARTVSTRGDITHADEAAHPATPPVETFTRSTTFDGEAQPCGEHGE